ncbi:E3 ubiquitin-protein ligase COP1-like isoform X1 [Artemia franciscana]|uniref:E3 ubiquitin-protein ligase COP1-like isoform X1 n=1 Tax=Artemia franciscana TaxID=6661 RepID=UPI0032DA8137
MAMNHKRGKFSGSCSESTILDRNNEFLCPICFQIIEEAHVTICGHSFCYGCITKSLELSNRCPKCNFVFDCHNKIFPNFLLNELIAKFKCGIDQKLAMISEVNFSDFVQGLETSDVRVSLPDVNRMLNILTERKKQLESDSKLNQLELMKEFLTIIKSKRQNEVERLKRELAVIERDEISVNESIRSLWPSVREVSESTVVPDIPYRKGLKFSTTAERAHGSSDIKRKRLREQINDLEACYLENKASDFHFDIGGDVNEFNDLLYKFTCYSSLRPLATIHYSSDVFNNSSIVSSIEFDKDGDYFAVAGVTKRVKLYEFSSVINGVMDLHYPIVEIVGSSKVSCLTYNHFHKNYLGSSDYEGNVTIWDVSTGKRLRSYQEHERRCWSVDFNRVDTNLLASGSDDAKIKLWSLNADHSIATIEAKANICCVRFNPESRYHLAFGSADHSVHYYDIRKPKGPLMIFKEHKKAVSYVKFLSGSEIVSASTDSQLKLWNTSQTHSLRTFQGHVNEKNFVGLAAKGDFIAVGSENNAMYLYFKKMSKPIMDFKFDQTKNIIDKGNKDEENNEFISAVCWKRDSNYIVAANSQGIVKTLEIV